MRKWLNALILGLLCFGLMVIPASASIGIGLGCGFKFDLSSVQKKQTYHVGQMCILDTGTEAGWFHMDAGYLYQQPELKVPKEWVKFTPETFWLEPCTRVEGGYICPFDIAQKVVQIDLIVPSRARFGDYFAYLEGCTGQAIGVCVAAPLRFEVVR